MKFNTINDLIREHNFDMTHWINIESSRFIKRKAYDRTLVKLEHCPAELLNVQFKCKNGHSFKPNWLEKRPPISVFYCKDRGLLRQTSCFVKCNVCDEFVNFEIPQPEYKCDLDIFGDEASRCVDGKTIFTYSFVSFSGSKSRKQEFESEFLSLKSKLSGSIAPDDWVLHMKELTSTEKRKEKEYLAHLSYPEVIVGVNQIIDLLHKYNSKGDLNIYSAVGIAPHDNIKHREKLIYQSNVYNSVLMRVVRESTTHGLAPKFYFERTNCDGWAKNLFDGGRLTLLWGYISNGLPVMTPRFVEPSFNLFLEVADIVSYVIARYLFCLGRKVEGHIISTDFDPTLIGQVRYMLIDGKGHWIHETSTGFPTKKMFKNTKWEPYT